jgi:hypothetical protein
VEGNRITARDLVGMIVVLPALVYGAGYLLWTGASLQLYGRNVAPFLSVTSLIEPGVQYVGALLLAGLIAAMIGLERLAPMGRVRRPIAVGFAILLWSAIICVLAAVGRALALGRSAIPTPGTDLSNLYSIVLLIVLAEAIRRTHGLLKGRFAPPTLERRRKTRSIRLLHAILLALLAFVHVHLALVFGVVGPNPAMRISTVRVTYRTWDPGGEETIRQRELYFIERNSQRLLGFDPGHEELIQVPASQILEMSQPRLSFRQSAFLETLKTEGSVGRDEVARLFPIRDSLRRRELAGLQEQGLIEQTPGGAYRLCSPSGG